MTRPCCPVLLGALRSCCLLPCGVKLRLLVLSPAGRAMEVSAVPLPSLSSRVEVKRPKY